MFQWCKPTLRFRYRLSWNVFLLLKLVQTQCRWCQAVAWTLGEIASEQDEMGGLLDRRGFRVGLFSNGHPLRCNQISPYNTCETSRNSARVRVCCSSSMLFVYVSCLDLDGLYAPLTSMHGESPQFCVCQVLHTLQGEMTELLDFQSWSLQLEMKPTSIEFRVYGPVLRCCCAKTVSSWDCLKKNMFLICLPHPLRRCINAQHGFCPTAWLMFWKHRLKNWPEMLPAILDSLA